MSRRYNATILHLITPVGLETKSHFLVMSITLYASLAGLIIVFLAVIKARALIYDRVITSMTTQW